MSENRGLVIMLFGNPISLPSPYLGEEKSFVLYLKKKEILVYLFMVWFWLVPDFHFKVPNPGSRKFFSFSWQALLNKLWLDVPSRDLFSESGGKGPESPDALTNIKHQNSVSLEFSYGKESASVDKQTSRHELSSLKRGRTLKKLAKILPCPRCKSMNTKFCYYNNYNAHQPRHLCKNCQRFWTVGGCLRNVPVGSGRRKTKSSKSSPPRDHRLITCPQALGTDAPGRSVESSNQINGSNYMEKKMAPTPCREQNSDEQSSNCSMSSGLATKSLENRKAARPCFNPSTLLYPWIPAPLLFAPLSSEPIRPATCCASGGTWDAPRISPVKKTAPTDRCPVGAGSGTRSVKRAREGDAGNMPKKASCQRDRDCFNPWIYRPRPSTSMSKLSWEFDGPGRVAKSSTWAMIPAMSGKAPDAFQFQPHNKTATGASAEKRKQASYKVLRANPPAHCRSLGFHEKT